MQPDTKQKKPAMEVRDLFFSYGKNKVLKGTSFTIEEGKITTIMGANGCGKSTLFNLMTKNLYPRKGNILPHGKTSRNLGLKDFARRVVPSSISIIPRRTTLRWNGWYPLDARPI